MVQGPPLAPTAVMGRRGAKIPFLKPKAFGNGPKTRHETRFEQYDLNMDLPPLLVPRRLRLPIRERIDAHGEVLLPLDDASVARAIEALAASRIEAVAVGFLHSFTNPDHERRGGGAHSRRVPPGAGAGSSGG